MFNSINVALSTLAATSIAFSPVMGASYNTYSSVDANYASMHNVSNRVSQYQRGQRSVENVYGQGIKLNTLPGDQVSIQGNFAYWKDSENRQVAIIHLTGLGSKSMKFEYDSYRGIIAPIDAIESYGYRCASKWSAFGWGVLWGGLVCGPLTLASLGTAAFACGVAGSAIATAASC